MDASSGTGAAAVAVASEGQAGAPDLTLANLMIENVNVIGAGDVLRELGRLAVVAGSDRVLISEIRDCGRRVPQLEPFHLNGGRCHRPRVVDPYRAHPILAVLLGRSSRRLVHVVVWTLSGRREVSKRSCNTGQPQCCRQKSMPRPGSLANVSAWIQRWDLHVLSLESVADVFARLIVKGH